MAWLLVLAAMANAAGATPVQQPLKTNASAASSSGLPNIVLVLTDDLDETLGGAASLKKTRALIVDQGAEVPNWFVHTPVCCPSRAELLTGRMFHNIKTSGPDAPGCMHVDVKADLTHPFYQDYYFARHFAAKGYTVGVFGKHLNNGNPTQPPPGVDRWLVNDGGAYLNPSFTWASSGVKGSAVHFDNCTDGGKSAPCYSTSVIGNASLAWIREHLSGADAAKSSTPPKPFFAYVAVKAPHIQDGPGWPVAIPAPWYEDASVHTQAPRTPNYNASCPDHHWLIRQQPPLTAEQAEKADELYASRLRALLSVDDLVEGIVGTLEDHGVLNQTYILFTSDHGYRFGQFRMPQGKWNTYENDVRVPLYVRGPGVPAGLRPTQILGSTVDVMPTLLGLASGGGGDVPSEMDGRSFAAELLQAPAAARRQQQRTSLLIEYIGLGNVVRYEHLEDTANNTFRALRVMDPSQSAGMRNIKYVEFTDSLTDWNFTSVLETELFDLDSDPFEMTNLAASASKEVVAQLHSTAEQLYRCAGSTCRGDTHVLMV